MKIWPGQTEDFKPPLMSSKEKGNLWLGLSVLFLVLAATSYFSPHRLLQPVGGHGFTTFSSINLAHREILYFFWYWAVLAY